MLPFYYNFNGDNLGLLGFIWVQEEKKEMRKKHLVLCAQPV